MDLVLAGKVTYQGHNTYTVQSGSHTYRLAPLCDCQDAQHRSKYCKHYLAVQLHQAAHATLYGACRNGTANGMAASLEPDQPADSSPDDNDTPLRTLSSRNRPRWPRCPRRPRPCVCGGRTPA